MNSVYFLHKSLQTIQTKVENVVLEINTKYTIKEYLEVSLERAISALSKNKTLERVEIQSHASVYNMLGLFQMNESSTYANSTHFNLSYAREKMSVGLDFEDIDPNYRSIGTNYFDNNFTSYTIQSGFNPNKNISFINNIGIRKTKVELVEGDKRNNLVLNSRVSINYSKGSNFSIGYSNLRNTEKNYLYTTQTLQVVSIALSQNRQSFNISNLIRFKSDSTITLINNINVSKGLAIQFDSVQVSNNITNVNYSTTLTKIYSKHSLILSSNYINSIANHVTSNIITFSLQDEFSYGEGNILNCMIQHNQLFANEESIPQTIFKLSNSLAIKSKIKLDQELEIRASSKTGSYQPNDFFVGINCIDYIHIRTNGSMIFYPLLLHQTVATCTTGAK